MDPAFVYRARVVSIYDGDTMRVDIDLGLGVWACDQVIRLYGIDTPEIRGEEREAGLVSRDWMREQVLGKEIVLQTYKDAKGKYGRWLGSIHYEGRDINRELIDRGLAEPY